MRKIQGSVTARDLPNGGLRIEIRGATGEAVCTDLSPEAAERFRSQFAPKKRRAENPTP